MPTEDFSLTTIQVRAAQDGDSDALDALFARYLPRVSRIVAARVGRRWQELALGDDVVQETFVDAFVALKAGRITNEAAFCSWIARAVENNLLNEIRHERAARRGGGNLVRFADLGATMLADSIFAGDGGTPSQHASANEAEERLERALLEINPRYREIISLRAYCKMPFKDIAESMGLPSENTASVLFRRARAELLRRLES